MSEPLYCMRCGQEECDHYDGWWPECTDAKYCHTCGAQADGGCCDECRECMGEVER